MNKEAANKTKKQILQTNKKIINDPKAIYFNSGEDPTGPTSRSRTLRIRSNTLMKRS